MTKPKRRFRPLETALFVVPLLCLIAASWWVWNRPAPPRPVVVPRYTITDLGPAIKGSWISDLNDKGEAVGAWGASNKTWRPAIWKAGKMKLIGKQFGIATAINNEGSVVINFEAAAKTSAFLWKRDKLQSLGTLGGSSSYADDINNRDEIVGFADAKQDDTIRSHAFMWKKGVMRDLSGTDSTFNLARAINERGEIVGTTQSRQACLWQDGNFTVLPGGVDARDINSKGTVLGQGDKLSMEVCVWINGRKKTVLWEKSSQPMPIYAQSINDQDQVVGSTTDAGGGRPRVYAFLYTGEQVYDLNMLVPPTSGWYLRMAIAINNRGQIAGEGTLNGKRRFFLLTPITSRVPQQSSTR